MSEPTAGGGKTAARVRSAVVACVLVTCGCGTPAAERAVSGPDDCEGAAARPAPRAPFEVVKRWHVASPHQIAFDDAGTTALVACAGASEVAVLDLSAGRVRERLSSPGTPVGVGVTGAPEAGLVLIARYAESRVEVRGGSGRAGRPALLEVGSGPGALVGPLPGGRFLVSAERGNQLAVLSTRPEPAVLARIPTGPLPGAAAVTRDGARAFVPSAASPARHASAGPRTSPMPGAVQVVDLSAGRVLPSIRLDGVPRACALTADERLLGVTLRETDRVVWVEPERRVLVGETALAPGDRPAAIVTDPVTGLVFVACQQGGAVVVLDQVAGELPRVVARIAAPGGPAALAVRPRGRELWVACPGSDELLVVRLPGGSSRTGSAQARSTPPAVTRE